MKPRSVVLLICVFVPFIGVNPIIGQNYPQKLIWNGFTFNHTLSPSWFNETAFMERYFVNPFEQSQFLVRTRFHKKVSEKMNYGFRGRLFLFHKSGSKDFQAFTQPELRPHRELNFRSVFGQLEFENCFRGELRYFQNMHSSQTELSEGYHFSAARFWRRLQTIIPLAIFSGD